VPKARLRGAVGQVPKVLKVPRVLKVPKARLHGAVGQVLKVKNSEFYALIGRLKKVRLNHFLRC